MRKPVLGTLLAASLSLSVGGCIIATDDDDDDGVPGDGGDFSDECGANFTGILYNPTWLCPPEADTITFTATPVGSAGSLNPDTFNCDDPQPAIICYDPGNYDIEVLPGGSVGEFAAQLGVVDGEDGDLVEDDFEFTQDGGFLFVDWTIDGADPLDACADIGAVSFAVDATHLDTSDLFTHEVDCEQAATIAPDDVLGWPLGEYILDISLLDADDLAISEPEPITDIVLEFGDQLFDVGTVDFVTN